MNDYTVNGQGSMKRLLWGIWKDLWGVWIASRLLAGPLMNQHPDGLFPVSVLLVLAVVLLVLSLWATVQAWRNRSYVNPYGLVGMLIWYGCAVPAPTPWLTPWLWVMLALSVLRFLSFFRDRGRGALPQQTGKPRDRWDQYELDTNGGEFPSLGRVTTHNVVDLLLDAAIVLIWVFAPQVLSMVL